MAPVPSTPPACEDDVGVTLPDEPPRGASASFVDAGGPHIRSLPVDSAHPGGVVLDCRAEFGPAGSLVASSSSPPSAGTDR